jgi:prepilin peptidase CpaA
LSGPNTWLTAGLWILVAVAAGSDLRVRRIPNTLIGLGLLSAAAAQWWADGNTGLLHGATGAGLGLVLLIGPFALRALGGGDVKLAMVIGAWTDGPVLITVLLYGALLTGIIAVVFWSIHARWPMETAPRIPVAVPLAIATIATTAGIAPALL